MERAKIPCLVADHCFISKDPKTRDREIIFLTNDDIFKKKGMKDKYVRKLQYQLGVSDIGETIVLSPDGEEKTVLNDGSFKTTVEQCWKFVFKVLAPTIVVFKEAQRDRELFLED